MDVVVIPTTDICTTLTTTTTTASTSVGGRRGVPEHSCNRSEWNRSFIPRLGLSQCLSRSSGVRLLGCSRTQFPARFFMRTRITSVLLPDKLHSVALPLPRLLARSDFIEVHLPECSISSVEVLSVSDDFHLNFPSSTSVSECNTLARWSRSWAQLHFSGTISLQCEF